MQADAVELRVLRLPLVRPFVTSQSTTAVRNILLVRVLGDGIEGWGECAAEDVAPMLVLFRERRADSHPMARAALEMATFDAQLRTEGMSLAQHLGGSRTTIDATATVGFDDDVDEFVAAGYRSLKLKIEPGRMPRRIPSGVDVQADANGSFAGCAEQLEDLDELGLACIEQPLGADDLAGHAALAERLQTPVCLDESIMSIGHLDAALALRAADVACIKPSRLGGLMMAKEAQQRCHAAGAGAKVGGTLETGIGRAAALALASLPGFTLPADLSASDRYWEHDVTPPFMLDAEGRLSVPTGPGLGVDIRMDVVERVTVSVELVRLN